MQALIKNVLALSTIDETIERETFNLEKAVENAMSDLEVRIMQTNARINVSPLPDVLGNEAYLSQLFYNLISNAIKFSKQNPVVTINGESLEGQVIITVADNGIGIPGDKLQDIFNAFTRIHSKTEYEGTGIGLAICKKIVDVHRGTITVASQEGIGTTFTIMLPSK